MNKFHSTLKDYNQYKLFFVKELKKRTLFIINILSLEIQWNNYLIIKKDSKWFQMI